MLTKHASQGWAARGHRIFNKTILRTVSWKRTAMYSVISYRTSRVGLG